MNGRGGRKPRSISIKVRNLSQIISRPDELMPFVGHDPSDRCQAQEGASQRVETDAGSSCKCAQISACSFLWVFSGGGMMLASKQSRFIAFVKQHVAVAPLLPAVRITNVVGFDKIVEVRELVLSEEKLLYFFYGKPSYKIPKKYSVPTKLMGDAAVCFVFDLLSLPELHKVFAFDTGAYYGERYDKYLPNGLQIADFELPAEHQTLLQLVTAFFGDNRNYYNGVAKNDLAIPALDTASEVYAAIIRSSVSEDFDERSCTCELQFDKPISLSTAKLITIIMPGLAYDDPEVKRIVNVELRIKPLVYRFKKAKPEERTEVIYEKLGEYYESCQLF
jgi:hypothetical protein